MKASVDFNGILQEARDFQRTEAALASKTWISDSNASYGYSRLPSKAMLSSRGDLSLCPHDYMLESNASALALILAAPASKLKWKLEFSSAEEKALWLKGHLLKTLETSSLPDT